MIMLATTHKGTLKAMSRRGLIKYPVDVGFIYVDEIDNKTSFVYKKKEYVLKYIPGCFYPLVFSKQ